MPNWETFNRKARPKVASPLVTKQASGAFSMNEAAHEALGRPEHVELLFDPDERLVGFRPTDDKSPHAYPIKPQQNARTFQTGGRAFSVHYGINTGKAQRYAAEMMDGVLVIDLKSEARDVGKRSGPKVGNKGRV